MDTHRSNISQNKTTPDRDKDQIPKYKFEIPGQDDEEKTQEKEKSGFNIFAGLFKSKGKNDSSQDTKLTGKKALSKPFIPKINLLSPSSNSSTLSNKSHGKNTPHSIIGNILLAKSSDSNAKFSKERTSHFFEKLSLHFSNINLSDSD